MSEHISTEKIHDLLDGLLPAAAEADVRAHMDGCTPCREELARLEEVVTAVRGLPLSAKAPEGIWEAVQARVGDSPPGAADDVQVVDFPGAASPRRRFQFTLPQLAAATLLVSVLSAGSVWMAVSGLDSRSAPTVAAGGAGSPAARAASLGDAGYAEAVAELEAILEQGRGLLAPETEATIDRSLQDIDEALAEVEAALREDPSSAALGRMLVNHQRARLRLLGQAAVAVRARS
jgi:anti-sigma factor RsiW